MIDVPIAVRDALKDGGYKKNYRFEVGHVVVENIYEDVATIAEGETFTINLAGDYRIFNSYHASGFEYDARRGSVGVRVIVEHPLEDPDGGYYDDQLTQDMETGWSITLISAPWEYTIQRKTNETKEVYVYDFTIENNHLVKESVKIDERMCSDDNIRFGLCEGSNLEFQAFDIENITKSRIQTFVDVEYPEYYYDYDETTNITTKTEVIKTYSIPMGWYDVQETSRQASTGIRKVSAYNKLKSDYLDVEVNALIIEEFGSQMVRIIDILTYLLRKYGIKTFDYQELVEGVKYKEIRTTPKKYFAPFRYTDYLSYEMGAFTSEPFRQNGTGEAMPLNKNIYIEGVAAITQYSTGVIKTPIQIRIGEEVEQIDTAIATYIQTELAKLEPHCNTEAAVLWARLKTMKNNDGVPSLNGYFFHVRVWFKDGHQEVYGNNVPNADGTFSQLNRKTFLDVSLIQIVTPFEILYGTKFNAGTGNQYIEIVGYNNGISTIWNRVPLTGGQVDRFRTPPKMIDGSNIPRDIAQFFKVKTLTGGYTPAELIEIDPTKMASLTLRNLQTAVFEMSCQFGKLDRVNNMFMGVELNNGRLYPATDLYPDDELYPLSTSESGFRAIYSKLWADEGNVRVWRNLIITYKGLIEDEETHEISENEKIYQTTINANGTDDYEVKDNWLFKNLLWADSESSSWAEAAGLENVEDYAAAMVEKMTSVSWFPFEMWCAGLPYVETGDEVEINTGDGAYTSYVLRRTIKGIQNLQDEMINGTLDIF